MIAITVVVLPLLLAAAASAAGQYSSPSAEGQFWIDTFAKSFPKDAYEVLDIGQTYKIYREMYVSFAVALAGPNLPTVQKQKIDVVCGSSRVVPAHWFIPVGATDRTPVTFYMHGGGYALGNISVYDGVLTRFADETATRVFYAEYALAPELPYPGQVDDALCVYQHLVGPLGVNPANIVFAGDSAGGGMTLQVLQRILGADKTAAGYKPTPLPAAAVLLSAWTDPSCTTSESLQTMAEFDPWLSPLTMNARQVYFLMGKNPQHSPFDPLVAPVYGSFRGMPPLYFLVGASEILLSDTLRAAARARSEGVQVRLEVEKHMMHIYPLFDMPEGRVARQDIKVFIHHHTTGRHVKDEL